MRVAVFSFRVGHCRRVDCSVYRTRSRCRWRCPLRVGLSQTMVVRPAGLSNTYLLTLTASLAGDAWVNIFVRLESRRTYNAHDNAPVFSISRDWSRSGIKPCNPKNQIWDNPEKNWYLSQSGCGIKSGKEYHFSGTQLSGTALRQNSSCPLVV